MKVLFLTRSVTIPGGWERYCKGLVEALALQGVEPILLAHDPTPDPDFAFNPQSERLSWTEWSRRQFVAVPINLVKVLRYLAGVEIIHATVESLAPLAWAVSRLTGKPYFITGHGTYAIEPFAAHKMVGMARRVYEEAEAVACVSDFTTSEVKKYCPQAPAVTVPNGFTPPAVEPAHDNPVDGPYFLTVGPLKTRKGQMQVLEAWAELAGHHPEVTWINAGYSYDQKYPEAFQQRVFELGLDDRVKVLGRVDEPTLQRLYRDCLFNVLTPLNEGHAFEGFGLTYLEAGWYSKPSVASTGCGAGESITHGENGYLIDQGDVRGLSRALDRLLNDVESRDRMGIEARQRAENMTWSRSAGIMLDLYRAVLSTA